MVVAVVAGLCPPLGVTFAAGADTSAYPPPGSPDPGPPCLRRDAPPWLGFFCRFMTVDLWEAAGRPTFTAPDGSHWQPWFYGDLSTRGNNLLYEGYPYRRGREGFLEAMLKTDKLPDEYDPAYVSRFWSLFRYAPWSVYFEHKAGCNDRQIINPYDFSARGGLTGRFPRAQLLGLGWSELTGDTDDPTRALGGAAMLVLMSAANLDAVTTDGQRKRIANKYSLRDEVNAQAKGKGELHPDYFRDGEVWLVEPDGTKTRIDDLNAAAAYVVGTGVLFTNEAYSTWQDGLDLAKRQAGGTHRALVYIYFAQDLFYPVNDNRVYRQRLQYLVDRAVRLVAPDEPGFTFFSMGRSASIAAHAAGHREQISLAIAAPVPGPWGEAEYQDALRGGPGKRVIRVGDQDFAAPAGAGVPLTGKVSLCLARHGLSPPR
jgi:hypothetical protein